MKYKHLFFDLDRTLWDYDANASKALSEIYRAYELDKSFSSAEEFLERYNHHNDILWDDYRNGNILKEELRTKRFELTLLEKGIQDRELCTEIGDRYMYITPRLNILAPNTIDTLEYLLQKGYSMYILTNGFLSTQQQKMAHSKLDKYFKRIFSSEELGINKPRKEIFHWAVSSIHANKKECVMIGDDVEVDIMGAMKYGIDTIWFNPSNLHSEKKSTYIIQDMSDLKEIL